MRHISRRDFLHLSTRAAAGGVFLPGLHRIAPALAGAQGPDNDGRILVVIELSGGNDGLNTVVPLADDAYAKARPTLAVPAKAALRLDDAFGLHPELQRLRALWDDGQLAVVHGVGYPQPNRSHFASMDIWHSADPGGGLRRSGWLGRTLAAHAGGDARALPGMQVGGELSLAMRPEHGQVPSISGPESLLLRTDPRSGQDAAAELRTIPALSAFPRGEDEAPALRCAREAFAAACAEGERLRRLAAGYTPAVAYEGGLGQRLGFVARMIDARTPARIYYTSTGGYDTHASQEGAHNNLHRGFARALGDFLRDLAEHGHRDRVAVLVFSEFGRRVAENGSRGTDHGTAGPVFLAGFPVRGGLYGTHPSLTDLDQGDLKFTTDFRSVYASVLRGWLHAPDASILGAEYPSLPLFRGRVV